jgi:hypothetical protein
VPLGAVESRERERYSIHSGPAAKVCTPGTYSLLIAPVLFYRLRQREL